MNCDIIRIVITIRTKNDRQKISGQLLILIGIKGGIEQRDIKIRMAEADDLVVDYEEVNPENNEEVKNFLAGASTQVKQ